MPSAQKAQGMNSGKETLFSALDESKSVSSKEVAQQTGWALRTVQKYARLGIIPGAFQPAGKHSGWRFKRNVVEAWWQSMGN